MEEKVEITIDELEKEMEHILLIDIRDEISYQHGHIPEAELLLDNADAKKITEMLYHSAGKTKVVLYCSIGGKSKEVVEGLRREGVLTYNLKGGFRSWLLKHTGILNKEENQRYSRQMILPQIGQTGQVTLKKSRVLVVGAGGLGSPAALYLAAAGIGTIGLIDGDDVDLSNLQRQILHDTAFVGERKVISAKKRLQSVNPNTEIITYADYITPDNITDILGSYDFVIDGADNFETKFLINDACVIRKIPFCHAGILRFEGQVMTYVPGEGACYRCIFEDIPKDYVPNCAEAGIIGAMAGVIGSIQALEAIKYITGAGELLTGRMYILDGLSMQGRTVSFPKRSRRCKVCGEHPQITDVRENREAYQTKLCGL